VANFLAEELNKGSSSALQNSVLHSPHPGRVSVLLQWLRWRLLRNSFATLLHSSPMRLISIVLCSLVVWTCIYAGSIWGFHSLHLQQIPFAGGIIGTLFDMLFLALAIMLLFSTGIILYSSLYSSAETAFLLSTPAPADRVFAYKYQGAIAFSSWAFILLGSPILLAYGWVFEVPWYFYALLPLFSLGFVLLPGCLGAFLCLLIVNFVPRRRKQVLLATALLLAAACILWGYRLSLSARAAVANPDALQRLLGQVSFAQEPFVPSNWMARGLEAAARGDVVGAFFPLALVWSNGLFLYVLTMWTAARLYRRSYNRLWTGGALRRRYGGHWLDHALGTLTVFFHPQTRLLIIKDFRTFRRDPAQWAQVLIFASLLVFYSVNTRRFYQEDIGRVYQSAVSLLNLTATAFLLCAYTGRFIYPMLSLEGRKFWILGLLPLQRQRLVWGKFAFSAIGALGIAELLVILSDLLLGMTGPVIVLHAVTVGVLAAGLSGLSVGLGACLPNFRESDPSKIAVGFGGTLNLVAGLLFLLAVIGLMAVPYHLFAATGQGSDRATPLFFGWQLVRMAAGLALGVLAVIVPLRLGVRALGSMEF
jgi:ABC-2 type transport system permease protein